MAQLLKQWDEKTSSVLGLEALSLPELWLLVKDTYRVLTAVHKDECVPKEIVGLFLSMEEFLYFASLMEEKETGLGFYHWQELKLIVDALKAGFFKGHYDYAYPQLKVTDPLDNDFLVDFDQNQMEHYVAAVQTVKAEEN